MIKDLVRDFAVLRVQQVRESKKQNRDSLRLYAGTKLAKDAAKEKQQEYFDDESRLRSTAEWGNENTNKKNTLFR